MSFADKFEAFTLIKHGSNYNLIPYSQDEFKNNVNQIKDEIKTNEKKKKKVSKKNIIKKVIVKKVQTKKNKKKKKKKNLYFLKKLKLFFNSNKKTQFLVKNIKKFVFMVGKFILNNPKGVYNFLFLNEKKILKSNLFQLKKIIKLMTTNQKKIICKLAMKKLSSL